MRDRILIPSEIEGSNTYSKILSIYERIFLLTFTWEEYNRVY
jgi:hypothetical protein